MTEAHDSGLATVKTKSIQRETKRNKRWRSRHPPFSPWLHENTAKVDLSVKVDVQHLLQVVLETHTHTHSQTPVFMQTVRSVPWKRGCVPATLLEQQGQLAFSPIDTPPEVMMTSARLIPSWRADSRSSGLKTHFGRFRGRQTAPKQPPTSTHSCLSRRRHGDITHSQQNNRKRREEAKRLLARQEDTGENSLW